MSKHEKLEKVRKRLIIVMVILLVVMISLIMMFILPKYSPKYSAGYKAKPMENYYCYAKGKVCNLEDLQSAIKVSIAVNNAKSYDFYMIANDEDTATFMMASNIKDNVDWHIEGINFRGPTKAMRELLDATYTWSNLDVIQDYTYEDYGYKFYQQHCSTFEAQMSDLFYDCSTGITPARGYKSLNINITGLKINFNIPKDSNMKDSAFYENRHVYARLASVEEIFELSRTLDNPDWLIDGLADGEGYWTMSSSTLSSLNYNGGAFAVVNNNGSADIVELRTMNKSNEKFNKIGIRPVITIQK